MASKVQERPSAKEFLDRQVGMLAQGFSFSGYERDGVFVNRDGARFLEVSGVSGMDSITDGRAAVFADLDNDGDTDVFLRAMHDQAHLLFRNDVGTENGFVRVALQGTSSGRDAWGAVVRLKTSVGTLTQAKLGGSGFLSQADPRLLFGLGKDAAAEWLEVAWPSGVRQRFPGPRAGESIVYVEGGPAPRPVREKRFSLPDPLGREAVAWKALRLRRGEALPDLALLQPDGSAAPAVALGGAGVPTIVNFWATWCAPCAKELPELQALQAARGSALRVVGVSVDDARTRAGVASYVKKAGVTFPVRVADAAALDRVFATRDVPVPCSLLLDGSGRLVDVLAGWSRSTRDRLHAFANGASTTASH